MSKTFEEKLEFLKKCETGYVTDALNLLKIDNCWVEGVLPVRQGIPTVVGVAFTSKTVLERNPENPLNLYEVVDHCPSGHVLVWADISMLGENLMTRALNKGVAAVVANAKCRDINGMRNMSMPVFGQGAGIRLQPTYLKVTYETQVPVSIGYAKIYPGDVVVGDDDGIVIIPRDRFDDVFYQIEMIAEVECEAATANKENPDMPVQDFIKIISKKKILRK